MASGVLVGDGNVTQTQAYYIDHANNDAEAHYDTLYQYDWRDRLLQTRGPNNVATKRTRDNLGRAIAVETYHDANTNWAVDAGTPGELLAKTTTEYDTKGQIFRTSVFKVVNGAVDDSTSSRLVTNYWYDPRGRPIKTVSPSGLFSKTKFDTLGRAVTTYLSSNAAESTYTDLYDATNRCVIVTNDTVVEQTIRHFQDNGNVWLTRHFQRKDGDTTTTGELTATNARATYAAAWFDPVGRTTRTVDYGTNEGAAAITATSSDFNPEMAGTQVYGDTVAGHIPEPNTSALYIVAKYHFDIGGRVQRRHGQHGPRDAQDLQRPRPHDQGGRALYRRRELHGDEHRLQPHDRVRLRRQGPPGLAQRPITRTGPRSSPRKPATSTAPRRPNPTSRTTASSWPRSIPTLLPGRRLGRTTSGCWPEGPPTTSPTPTTAWAARRR